MNKRLLVSGLAVAFLGLLVQPFASDALGLFLGGFLVAGAFVGAGLMLVARA